MKPDEVETRKQIVQDVRDGLRFNVAHASDLRVIRDYVPVLCDVAERALDLRVTARLPAPPGSVPDDGGAVELSLKSYDALKQELKRLGPPEPPEPEVFTRKFLRCPSCTVEFYGSDDGWRAYRDHYDRMHT